MLSIAFDASEKRTHDYVRHGITNLFAVLNVGTGEVLGECYPVRDGANFLNFLKKAEKPHEGKDIHMVLDNLSTHTTPDMMAWLAANPQVSFRRRDPHQSPRRPNQHQETRRQQRKVKTSGSRELPP